MAYLEFKDLLRGTACERVLRDEVFIIAKNSKCDEYQRTLALIFYKFIDKNSSGDSIKRKYLELASFKLSYVTISRRITKRITNYYKI